MGGLRGCSRRKRKPVFKAGVIIIFYVGTLARIQAGVFLLAKVVKVVIWTEKRIAKAVWGERKLRIYKNHKINIFQTQIEHKLILEYALLSS